MTLPSWKYIFASVIGTSHERSGIPCQDMSECKVFTCSDDSPVLAAVVADGAGSAQRAEIGASLACSLFLDEMNALFECGGTVHSITRQFVENWIIRFQNEVSLRAETDGLESRDFACTILAAAIGSDCAAFLQVGDGAIIISSQEEPDFYGWVFWPQQGEYVNTTYFATGTEVFDKLEYVLINQCIDEIALLTDGLQSLVLHYETRTAFVRFFKPMFQWLRLGNGNSLDRFTSSLISYLSSEKINEHTDDDKTLVLATRRLNVEPSDYTE